MVLSHLYANRLPGSEGMKAKGFPVSLLNAGTAVLTGRLAGAGPSPQPDAGEQARPDSVMSQDPAEAA